MAANVLYCSALLTSLCKGARFCEASAARFHLVATAWSGLQQQAVTPLYRPGGSLKLQVKITTANVSVDSWIWIKVLSL